MPNRNCPGCFAESPVKEEIENKPQTLGKELRKKGRLIKKKGKLNAHIGKEKEFNLKSKRKGVSCSGKEWKAPKRKNKNQLVENKGVL